MRHLTRFLVLSTTIAVAAAAASPVSAQSDPEGIVLVDVMVVNDNGGTNDGTAVPFSHEGLGGATSAGTDPDPAKCLSSDGASCYIGSIPVGPGALDVPDVPGYTVTVDCVSGGGTSTATGATWDVAEFGEIFCVVMLDDVAPTTTTAAPTTLAPTTTVAPTTPPTTVAATTPVAPPTTTAIPAPALPETGPRDTALIALLGFACIMLGAGTVRIARR